MKKSNRRRKIIANLRNKHRLVLINDNNFAEVFSIQLTPINVLMVFSSLLVAFTALIMLLVAYTPMRALLPTAVTAESRQEILLLNQQVEDLRTKLEVKYSKQETLNKILEGNESAFDSTSVRPNELNK